MGRRFLPSKASSASGSKARSATGSASKARSAATSASKSKARSATASASRARSAARSGSRTETAKIEDAPDAISKQRAETPGTKAKRLESKFRAVYHPLRPEKDLAYPGYSKSGTDSLEDKRRKSSLSDDYKARVYQEAERQREKFYHPIEEAYSPEYHMFLLLLTSALIALLVLAIFSLKPEQETEIAEEPSTFDLRHPGLVIMTENIDCSIQMKYVLLQEQGVKSAIPHGMECLSLLVPSSAIGEKSTLSMTILHRYRNRGRVLRSLLSDMMDPSIEAKLESKFFYNHYQDGLLRLGDITENNTFAFPWIDAPKTSSEQAELWHRFETYRHPASPYSRRFKITPSLAEYLRENKFGDKEDWIDTYSLREDISFEKQFISPPLKTLGTHGIFRIRAANSEGGNVRLVPIYVEEKYHKQSIHLKNIIAMIPVAQKDLETSSIFSAYVIAVTARVIAEEDNFQRLEPMQKELLLVKTLLRAQEYAYKMVADCDEFGERGSLGSLLSDVAIQVAVEDIRANKISTINQVTKEGSDRVTSIVLSYINLYEGGIFSVTMSRLTRQSSSQARNGTGTGKSSSYPRFVAHEAVKRYSKPFTSAADISLFSQRLDNAMPLLSHVSVSGSIRTVESAASVTIRMLLERKSPAEAIRSPAALYDPRDKKFYCEHDRDFRQLLYATYKILCEDMTTGDKDMQDRVVMALKVKAANVGHSDRYMEAAVSREPTEYNYPVGN